jgi:hypothetical protein
MVVKIASKSSSWSNTGLCGSSIVAGVLVE